MPKGVVTQFDAERGFGFIRSADFPSDIFVHVTEIPGHKGIQPGQRVEFDVEHGDRGMRAVRVKLGATGLSPLSASAFGLGFLLVLLGFAFHKAGLSVQGGLFAGLNVLAFGLYTWDKHQAGAGRRRVPEAVLLGFAAIGGSIGAAVAMKALHHKTSKPKFWIPFVLIVVLQVVFLGYMASRYS